VHAYFLYSVIAKYAERTTIDSQALSSCTLRLPPSLSEAWKRSPGNWVLWDSCVGRTPRKDP